MSGACATQSGSAYCARLRPYEGGIDFEEVWETLAADLPALEQMIRDILAQT